ncbi:MAG TPA: hypothetical protein VGD65_11870 [Chryseosolibacter sp.]
MPKPAPTCVALVIAFALSLSLQGCAQATQSSRETLDAIARRKLGEKYAITYNASKDYALCQQTSSGQDHALRRFKFIVVSVSENTIINEGSFKDGYVKWIDNKSIEVSSGGTDEKRQTRIVNVNEQQS